MLPYELLGKFIHVLESEGFPPINQSGEFFSKFCRNNGVSTPLPREILNLKDTFMRGIKNKRIPFWVKNNPQLLCKYQKLVTMYHTIYKPQFMQSAGEDGSARTRPLQWSQLFARDTAPARYIVNAGGNYFDRPMEAANDEMPHLVPEKTMEERLMEMVDNEIEHNANEVGSDLFRREDADTVEQLREFVRSRSEIIQNQGNALREATVMLNNVKKQLVNYESIIHNKSTIIDEMNKQLRVSKQSYTKVWTSLQERAKTINYQRVKIQNLEKALNFANTCGAKKLVVRRMPKTNIVLSNTTLWQGLPIKQEAANSPQPAQNDVELVELE